MSERSETEETPMVPRRTGAGQDTHRIHINDERLRPRQLPVAHAMRAVGALACVAMLTLAWRAVRPARAHPARLMPGDANFTAAKARLLDTDAFDRMLLEARRAPRGRRNFNFHAPADALQAFVNAWTCAPGNGRCSYVQPHRHREPESLVVLRGRLAYFLFEGPKGSAEPTACHVLGPGGRQGIFVEAGVFHGMAAYGPEAIVWEVKLKQEGAYTVERNKEWLPGSIPEADADAADVALRRWFRLCDG